MRTLSGGPNIVTNGLVLYLDAGNQTSYISGSTSWKSMVTNITSSLINSPTFNTDRGGCINYDGASDYSIADVSTLGLNLEGPYTVEYTFKPTNAGNSLSLTTSTAGQSFQLGYLGGLYPTIWRYGGSPIGFVTAPSVYISQSISTVVCAVTSSNVTVYVNGQQQMNLNTPQLQTGNLKYLINSGYWAGSSVGGSNFNGNIYSIKLYNRLLSASEILQNYNATKARFGLQDTVGYPAITLPTASYTGSIPIDTGSLEIYLDASNPYSYTSGSNAWYNLAKNTYHAYLYNNGYDSANSGSITFVGNYTSTIEVLNVNSYILNLGMTGSYSGWVSSPSITGQVNMISDWAGNSGMTIRINNASSTDFYVYPGNYRITAAYSFANNTWYNLTGVMDGVNMYLYVNGSLVGSRSLPSGVGQGMSFKTGVRGDGASGGTLTGKIANLQVYSRALSSGEVLSNFNALKGRFGY